jgi:excisionase family DNA binding protein
MPATETEPDRRADDAPLSEVLAIDIPRAAQVLHLSAKTIRRRIKDGSIPSIRIGHRVRVPSVGGRWLLTAPAGAAK